MLFHNLETCDIISLGYRQTIRSIIGEWIIESQEKSMK